MAIGRLLAARATRAAAGRVTMLKLCTSPGTVIARRLELAE
jgi:hypothetical protein